MQDMLNHFIAGFEAGAITYIIGAFCSFSWNKSQSTPAMSFSTQISTQSVQETTELAMPMPEKTEVPKLVVNQDEPDQVAQRKLKPTEHLRQQCSQAGIQWRNVNGQGKHLSTTEMKQQLENVAIT